MEISVGHTPDSDDAFMFYGMFTDKVPSPDFKVNHVIEDIETYNNFEQISAFNFFNDCKENNKKLFVTGANSPKNMGLREDLASRLSWGLVFQIKALTDDEKKLALLSHAHQKGILLDKKIIEYCMKYLKRDLHYLIATLDALDNWSLKTKKPITIPLLQKLIAEKL